MKSVLALFFVLSIVSCASVERGSRTELVGHWRYMNKKQCCDYSFKKEGSFTGEVRHHARLVSKFTGRWTFRHPALLYTHISAVFRRIPSVATDRDLLLLVYELSFPIRSANGAR